MTEDIKSALTTYLSTFINDEGRTVKLITANLNIKFFSLTRTEVYDILHANDEFVEYKSSNETKIYWFLVDDKGAHIKHELDRRTYIFVDCDTNPDMFYYLADIASTCTNVFVRGYASKDYDDSRADQYETELSGFDEIIYFCQIKSGTADMILKLDLHSILAIYYNINCFVISTNKIITDLMDKLQDHFQKSNLCADEDSEAFRDKILACL